MTASIKVTRSNRVFTMPMICEDCGLATVRKSPVQKFCPDCSRIRDRARKEKYRKTNPHNAICKARYEENRRGGAVARGAVISGGAVSRLDSVFSDSDGMKWVRRVAIPYSQCLSKNAIWTRGNGGHVFIRQEAHRAREALGVLVMAATRDVKVVQNKLWIEVVVQKPSHKPDAINMLDSVCDGIKIGLELDDRWYSIRRLDWEIVKTNPQIMVGIGQDSDIDVQACSHCGRLLPFDRFWRSRAMKSGFTRACLDCSRVRPG